MALTFNVLTRACVKRLPYFRNTKGQLIYPPPHQDGSNWSLSDWATAALGELGEAANKIKKIKRGDFTLEEIKPELAAEIVDTQIYLCLLVHAIDIDLETEIRNKFNLVSIKQNIPVHI